MNDIESSFKNKSGLNLFYRGWPLAEPKAVLVISHGYAEHSNRYADFAKYLQSNGYSVYALDHRGHGKSDGERAHVDSFSDYVDDLKEFVDLVTSESSLPVYLLGHSMGGAIATLFAIRYQTSLAGLLISSAFIKSAVKVSPILLAISGLVAKIMPMKVIVKPLDAGLVSHDPQIVEKYKTDPLNYTEGTKARMGSELISAGPKALAGIANVTIPTLVMIGSDDQIADPEGGKELFEKLGSKDKTLKIYPGFYHEILNELEREKVYQDILEWLNNHLSMT